MTMDDLRETFKRFRTALNEYKEEEKKDMEKEAKPYTRQDELMSTSLQTTKTQFGADYSNIETPMLYYPKDGDVTLSGEIPDLNGAKFQFRYKDPSSNGCYIWVDSLMLSDDVVNKLSRIFGVYKNWKKELSTAEDIKPTSYRDD